MTPGRWELRDHPAPRLIHAEGDTVTDLFAAAAEGLLAQLGNRRAALAGAAEPITLAAPELADLLVAWLQLLLHLGREGARPVAIQSLVVDNVILTAEVVVGSEPLVPALEVKSVTFHGPAVRLLDGRWSGDFVLE